jgi:ribonuclease P protein component
MLPPKNRLRLTRDHRAAARLGVRGGSQLVVVHLVADVTAESTPPSRVGFVVGRAVGSAATRNAVRRRLRHLMRDRLDRLPAGSLVVVRARAGAGTAPSAVLARDLDTALQRALRSSRIGIERADDHESQATPSGGRR